MSARGRLVTLAMIALFLLGGCGAAEPTATPVPPTDPPPPPTATAAPPVPTTTLHRSPTATLSPTSIPPTLAPPTVTAQALTPALTTAPTPEIQSGLGGIAFADSGQRLGDMQSWDIDLGDLDGDGDLDAFVANTRWSHVWLNDGGLQGGRPSVFTNSQQQLGTISGVDLGDLDGDGDLDAFTVDFQRGVVVWLNNGDGIFQIGQRARIPSTNRVSLGDVDGDGDLDAFVATFGPNSLWLNDGGLQNGTPGEFTKSEQLVGGNRPIYDSSIDAILADLDGDEDLDVFEVIYNGHHRVWFNDGGQQGGIPGSFTNSGQVLEVGASNSHGVALGDLDGDGDLDAFVTVTSPMAFQVWFNDGGLQGGQPGTFTNSGQSLPSSSAQMAALGDLDGDGDLDAFMINSGPSDDGAGNTVWLNEGGVQGGTPGNFVDSGLRLGHEYSLGLDLGDLDGDGDLDAFVANSYFDNSGVDKSNKVWLNVSAPRP